MSRNTALRHRTRLHRAQADEMKHTARALERLAELERLQQQSRRAEALASGSLAGERASVLTASYQPIGQLGAPSKL